MHESGVIRRLLETAGSAARERGGRLAGLSVRLGALAGGTGAHLREHFQEEAAHLGLGEIRLTIQEDPEHPGGVEITGIDVSEAE